MLVLLFLGGLICLVRRGEAFGLLPREIWCLLWGSLILFGLAWVSGLLLDSFVLYLPSRYTSVGVFLFLSVLVFLNIADGIKEAPRLIHRHRSATAGLVGSVEMLAMGLILFCPSERMQVLGISAKWLLAPASLLLAVLAALSLRSPHISTTRSETRLSTSKRVALAVTMAVSVLGWGGYASRVHRSSALNPPPSEREVLAFVQTLRKDVLLAGTPCALNNIPLFAKRQILFSCEQISHDGDLMREALDAYYAEEPQAVLAFCRDHGVDYLVINRHTYSEAYIDGGWIFFEPHNQELLPIVRGRESFALAQVPEEAKVFEAGNLFVVPCTASALGG